MKKADKILCALICLIIGIGIAADAIYVQSSQTAEPDPELVIDEPAPEVQRLQVEKQEYIPASVCITALTLDMPAPEVAEPDPEDYLVDNIAMDYDTQRLLKSACDEMGVDYRLALSVVYVETKFQNIIGDNGNSIGYMQIQPRWHYDRMERLGVTGLTDPLSNFRVGCNFLAELVNKYGVERALTAYNSGSPGTSNYANTVMAYMSGIGNE